MKCPVCGYPLELHTNFWNKDLKPKAGDYGICIGCASVLAFDGKGGADEFPKADMPELIRQRPDIAKMIEGAKWVIMQKRQN